MSLTRADLHHAARQMALVAAAAEAVRALRAAEIRPILLKGASLATWLYPSEPWRRDYADVDLLVAPDRVHAAGAVLVALGYRNLTVPDRALAPTIHAYHWTRAEPWPADIDLHRRLYLMEADDDTVWSTLSESTETLMLGDVCVEVLGSPARAMFVALHAVWHGAETRGPISDLERALIVVDHPTWTSAAALARELDAEEAFGVGLRLTKRGEALASRMGLPTTASVELHLRAATVHRTSLGLLRLLEQRRSWRGFAALLASELAPAPDVIRAWTPLARRGRRGLAGAYVWRALWLAYHLPGAVRALMRARHAAGRDA